MVLSSDLRTEIHRQNLCPRVVTLLLRKTTTICSRCSDAEIGASEHHMTSVS